MREIFKKEWEKIKQRPNRFLTLFTGVISIVFIGSMMINIIFQDGLLTDLGSILLCSLVSGIFAVYLEIEG